MKKIVTLTALGLVLVLASLGAAAAAEVERWDGPEASSSEISLDAIEPNGFLAEIGLSDPGQKAGGSCSASLNCGDGNTVSCTGNSNCRTTIAGVECDGVENRCPNYCSVGVHCPNGRLRICWSTSGDCQQNPPACNGFPLICAGPF